MIEAASSRAASRRGKDMPDGRCICAPAHLLSAGLAPAESDTDSDEKGTEMVWSQRAKQPGSTRRRTVVAIASLALVGFVVFGSTALAAKPKSFGCWSAKGGCIGGGRISFFTQHGTVAIFTDSVLCGGPGGENHQFHISKAIPLTKDNTFSYSGPAVLLYTKTTVPVTLSGDFPTSTTAKVTFTVKYKSCGTYHQTAKWGTDPEG
jgi:hypothetical protein